MDFAHGWLLTERSDARRSELEDFVAGVYAQAYGARIDEFPPILAAITGPYRSIVGVIGARPACGATLFLEQYLDDPIERVVSDVVHTPVERARIAEVGSLASTIPGFGKRLMSSLAACLDGAAFEFAVFTATRQLRNSIRKWNASTLDLGPASGDRLGSERDHWGAYYDTDPRILAVHLASFRACMSNDAALARNLQPVWNQAWLDGERHRRWECAS